MVGARDGRRGRGGSGGAAAVAGVVSGPLTGMPAQVNAPHARQSTGAWLRLTSVRWSPVLVSRLAVRPRKRVSAVSMPTPIDRRRVPPAGIVVAGGNGYCEPCRPKAYPPRPTGAPVVLRNSTYSPAAVSVPGGSYCTAPITTRPTSGSPHAAGSHG